jgi:tetratricopeptide repeat protein 21B
MINRPINCIHPSGLPSSIDTNPTSLLLLYSARATATVEHRREQKEIAAAICCSLAEAFQESKAGDKAMQYYHEALKHNEMHEKARLALAKMFLLNGDLENCQHHCVSLLRIDPGNREASMMLADLMFRKNEHDAATYHFQQLLEKNPTRYAALTKLIQLLRRAGRLSDAPRYIKAAEKSGAKESFAAGLHFCKGLYAWYTNDPR